VYLPGVGVGVGVTEDAEEEEDAVEVKFEEAFMVERLGDKGRLTDLGEPPLIVL
jgi:hypothetical protein